MLLTLHKRYQCTKSRVPHDEMGEAPFVCNDQDQRNQLRLQHELEFRLSFQRLRNKYYLNVNNVSIDNFQYIIEYADHDFRYCTVIWQIVHETIYSGLEQSWTPMLFQRQ